MFSFNPSRVSWFKSYRLFDFIGSSKKSSDFFKLAKAIIPPTIFTSKQSIAWMYIADRTTVVESNAIRLHPVMMKMELTTPTRVMMVIG